MKRILFLIAALCGTMALSAQPEVALQSVYTIQTGGTPRVYELASDEIALIQSDGRQEFRSIAATDDVARSLRTLRQQSTTAKPAPVLYEAGRKHTRYTRATATTELVIHCVADAKAIATAAGLRLLRTPDYAPGYAILQADTPEAALAAIATLRLLPGVQSADILLARLRQKKTAPNDPLFANQWNLRNRAQQGSALWIDLNLEPVWSAGITGTGIVIGILDDGLQHAHPDLAPAYQAALSYDFNGQDPDPAPVDLINDAHGTSCAGASAARGNNQLGIAGVAYSASLAGMRLIAAANTDQDEANAFTLHNSLIHVKSNSWGEPDDGATVGGPGSLAKAALVNGVATGRGGKGTIYVFAGGNGLDLRDNSNYDGYANAIQVIAVGAVNNFGFQSYYSEPGANLVVCAPSSGGLHNAGIYVTDLTGTSGNNTGAAAEDDLADLNYSRWFGGTSAACPQIAGVVALLLQANPNLGWRDVKEILLRTARPIHATDPDWLTNAAGLAFNHKYGAGLADASASVALAQAWTNLPTAISTSLTNAGSTTIPDNTVSGVTRAFNFTDTNFRVEHVEVTLSATHPYRGDLEVILTSPSGMISRLAEQHNDDNANYSAWTFTSVRHWGENALGTWSVRVADRAAGAADSPTVGTLGAVTVKLHGTSTTAARLAGTTAALVSENNLPANGVADPGENVSFTLGLKNIGATATSNLTATLLPLGGVVEPGAAQSYGALGVGGTAVSRTFSFRSTGGAGTMVRALLKLQDGATTLGYASLVIPLGKSTLLQSSTGGSITIRDNNTGSPSPSSITVSGLSGRVQNLAVAINSFTHAFPDDVGLLLDGPDSLQIQLINGSTNQAISAKNMVFDDRADVLFPYFGVVPAGTYRSYDYYGSNRVMTLDPGHEPAYTLGEFNGLPVNGAWRLYAEDFAAVDAGSIGSWRLTFTLVDSTDNALFATATQTVSENAGTLLVIVRRTGGKEGAATVNYTTANGSATAGTDFTTTAGTLSFAAGELEKTIFVPLVDNALTESSETFTLTLSGADGNTQLGATARTTITIDDDDTPTPISLSPGGVLVFESATALTFTASRITSGTSGTIAYATNSDTATAGADFSTATGTLTFAAGDLQKTFTVSILNDTVGEADETFTVALSNPTDGLSLDTWTSSFVIIHDVDTDSDGLPDDYETTYGLNPASAADAALDRDGDGFTNLQEFFLGTSPANRTSTLVPAVTFSGNDTLIAFASITGRTYRIERSDTLAGAWMTVHSGLAGTGSTLTATDTGGASLPRRFYRVIVTQP